MKTEIKYGLIAGFSVCAWTLVEFALGFHTRHLEYGSFANQLSLLILIAAWFFMLRTKRDTDGRGALTFGQGLKAGAVASAVSAAIITVFSEVYNRVINPGWMQHAMEWETARLRTSGTSEAEIALLRKNFEAMAHAPIGERLLHGFIGTAVMSLIITAIIAVMIRRPPAQPAS